MLPESKKVQHNLLVSHCKHNTFQEMVIHMDLEEKPDFKFTNGMVQIGKQLNYLQAQVLHISEEYSGFLTMAMRWSWALMVMMPQAIFIYLSRP